MGELTRISNIADEIRRDLAAGKLSRFDGTAGFMCEHCLNAGWRYVDDPRDKYSNYRGVVRCDRCRYWEFEYERIRREQSKR